MAGELRGLGVGLLWASAVALASCGSRSELLDPTLVPSLLDGGEGARSDASSVARPEAGSASQDASIHPRPPLVCPNSGLTKLAGLSSARYLTLDDDHVYWADPDEGSFGRVHKCGGTPERLGQVAAGQPLDVVVVGEFLYATVQGDRYGEGQVVRLRKAGGRLEVLADNLASPEPLVSDGDALFFDEPGIMRMAFQGGPFVKVAPSSGSTYGSFPVDDTHVYWVDRTLMRAPKLGGKTEPVAESPDEALAWCAETDEAHVYWTTYTGQAYRVPKAGGTPEPIAEADSWRCMTLDSTHAYLAKDVGPVVAIEKRTLRQKALDGASATDVKVDAHYAFTTHGISPGAIFRQEKPAQ